MLELSSIRAEVKSYYYSLNEIVYFGVMKLKQITYLVWMGVVLYFCYLMLLVTLPYLSFKLNVDFLLTKQSIIHIKHWRYAFYAHILSSIFVLLAGVVQFWNYFLIRLKKWHRRIGKLYGMCLWFYL